jgi:predicted phosphodiesterase
MNTSGIFEVYHYTIPFDKCNEPIYLIPFGDVHRSAPLCHTEKWLEFCDWAKRKKNAYFLGMGDYDDLASASERRLLGDKNLHESTVETLEMLYNRHIDQFAKEVSFMKGRCIGIMGGNHYAEFQSGITSDQKLADKLGTKFLGSSCFVRLQFVPNTKHATTMSVDVWAHHGMGAARLVGGSMNRVQQMAEAAEADIYLMGHDHKKSAGMTNRLRLQGKGQNLKLSHRKILMARTGSFLKAYVEGKPSYIVDKAMNPTDLGVVKIELTPRRENKSGWKEEYVDIHASI